MESIAGIALGMNIIGNPKQFAGELQAGKNRGGVFAFLGGIVAATSNSLSKMIGTVGNGISQLTFDHKYQLDRVEAKEIKAESFLMGLKLGAMSFAKSIKSGFVGLVQQPI